jgi:hypothetical protein
LFHNGKLCAKQKVDRKHKHKHKRINKLQNEYAYKKFSCQFRFLVHLSLRMLVLLSSTGRQPYNRQMAEDADDDGSPHHRGGVSSNAAELPNLRRSPRLNHGQEVNSSRPVVDRRTTRTSDAPNDTTALPIVALGRRCILDVGLLVLRVVKLAAMVLLDMVLVMAGQRTRTRRKGNNNQQASW